MSRETQATPNIRGIAEQLHRVEDKLDRLLDALAEDAQEDAEPRASITTMDGRTFDVPAGDGFL